MPKKIHDEFTDLAVSRERKRQLRNTRDGLCKCGKTKEEGYCHCFVCLDRYMMKVPVKKRYKLKRKSSLDIRAE